MPPHTRRTFLGQLAATTLAAAIPGAIPATAGEGEKRTQTAAAGASAAKRKPNVLFSCPTTCAWNLVVTPRCSTPSLPTSTPWRRPASASTAIIASSRFAIRRASSLLTGRNPTHTSVLGNRTDFRVAHPGWTTLPQLFRQNGYVTVRSGKIFHGGIDDARSWGVTSERWRDHRRRQRRPGRQDLVRPPAQIPTPAGVLPPLPADTSRAAYSDRIVVLEGNGEAHGDYLTADRTIAHLRKYKDQPFFIACGFVKPHSPPTAPQKFMDLYDPKKLKLTPDFAAWPTVPPGFPAAAIRKRNADLFIGRAPRKTKPKKSSARTLRRSPGAIGTSAG